MTLPRTLQMIHVRVRLFLALIFGIFAVSGLASSGEWPVILCKTETAAAKSYAVRMWTTDEGLPQSTIRALLQTRDGYLWIGTQQGLARYDGNSITVFDASSDPPMPSDSCLSLMEDDRGLLWIGTTRGLLHFDGRTFSSVPGTEGSTETNRYRYITPSRNGRFYVATAGDLRSVDGSTRQITAQYPLNPPALQNLVAAGGTLWMSRAGELYQWEKESWRLTCNAIGTIQAEALNADASGAVWFATDRGLYRSITNTVTQFVSGDRSWDKVRDVAISARGLVWTASVNGISQFDGSSLINFAIPELSRQSVHAMYVDRDENVWIGLKRGLLQLRKLPFSMITKEDGLVSDDAWSIAEGPDAMWIATSHGISRFDGKEWQSFTSIAGQPPGAIRGFDAVFVDSTGTTWVGADGALAYFSNGSLQPFRSTNGLFPWSAGTIYEDSRKTLWLGTGEGLGSIDLTTRTVSFDSSLRRNIGVISDDTGAIWVGATTGLVRRANGSQRIFRAADGLAADRSCPLLAEPGGIVWAGSEAGLSRVTPKRISTVTTENGLPENLVFGMLLDEFGYIWFSGHRGVHRLLKKDLDAVADGRRARLQCESFTTLDGLLSTECNGTMVPHSCRTRDGRLWFPTIRGVAVVDPAKLPSTIAGPPVIIERCIARESVVFDHGIIRDFEKGGTLSLPPGSGAGVRFDYTAATFGDGARARFRHQLRGVDKTPVDAGTRRTAFYTSLRPGAYEFVAWAADHRGIWNETGATIKFTLQPYFYQTLSFKVALTAACLVLLGLLHRAQLRRARVFADMEHRVAIERDRTRIAENVHDHLGSTVTRIKLLLERARRTKGESAEMEEALTKLEGATRELVRDMDEIVWVVDPAKDSVQGLANYLVQYSQDYLRDSNIRCRLAIPTLLPEVTITADARHHIVLFVREALHNVIKHANATEVVVAMEILHADRTVANADVRAGALLALSIEDNGNGFIPSETQRSGHGVGSMRHRALALGGDFDCDSKPGRGTAVLLRVPLATLSSQR